MTFIEILCFTVGCAVLKRFIFLLAFPIMMIAAYFMFSGPACWIAMGAATSIILGVPINESLLNENPLYSAETAVLFDIIGDICSIIGLVKVF